MQSADAFMLLLDKCLIAAGSASSSALIVLEDSLQLPCYFLIHAIVKQRLQQGIQVLLVPISRSAESYRTALRKLGVSGKDSGNLQVLEPPSSQQNAPLQELALAIVSAVQRSQQQSSCVILDMLSDLECLANGRSEWLAFLHLLASHLYQEPCQVYLGVHKDVEDERTPSTALLRHAAQTLVQVRAVEGQVAGIHGQVEVMQRRSITDTSHAPAHEGVALSEAPLVHESLFFRSTDQGVQWITKLTSRQLLWE